MLVVDRPPVAAPSSPISSGPISFGLTPDRPVARLHGVEYRPSRIDAAIPPTLFVVVDTEAEFDWFAPFARNLTRVTAMRALGLGQAVFDRYGLRPIYLIDFPVASQPEGLAPLRAILDRGGCEVGAHLHPWTNPPFEEVVSDENSYPGNLDPGTEERKLVALLAEIRRGLGVQPAFYKAGRYGLGPHTLDIIARHGIAVDFSILPGTDLRYIHGPDFRGMEAVPYEPCGAGLLSLPMTRGHIGPLARLGAPFGARLDRTLDAAPARLVRLRGQLSKLGLIDRVSLTPEGVSADRQIALIRAMLRRGRRMFVMHYHSPSLAPGHTPYVRTEADAAQFLRTIDAVCRWFFETLGGRPGDPRTLLPPSREAAAARRNDTLLQQNSHNYPARQHHTKNVSPSP